MNVAVIGAGPSGLVAARYLKKYSIKFDIYERRNTLGGVWRKTEGYDVSTLEEDIIATSPIYNGLRTNTPVAGVSFEDLDYDGDDCFPSWLEVNKYLKKYANKFELAQSIFFQTEVIRVSWENEEWKVCFRNNITGDLSEKNYNAVLVCNGHEEVPITPSYEGASLFQGLQLHSKRYRKAEHYSDQNVLVIGVGPSGLDISLQLSVTAKTVYLSHHKKEIKNAIFPPAVVHKPDIKKFTKSSVIFEDDSEVTIDAVIYCTGYDYSISFIDKSCGIILGDKYIKNLYKRMFCIEHPTLIFCGAMRLFFILVLSEWQAKLAAKYLSGLVSLPTKEEMFEDTRKWEEMNRLQGRKENKFFELEERSRDYLNDLARIGSLPEPPEAIFDLFDCYYQEYIKSPTTVKKNKFKIIKSKFIFEPCAA